MNTWWVCVCEVNGVCVFVKKKEKKKMFKKKTHLFFTSLYKLLETFRALMKHPRQTIVAD